MTTRLPPGLQRIMRRAGDLHQHREAGMSTTLISIVGFAVALMCAGVLLQMVLTYLANTSAISAAQEGARVASLDGASAIDGQVAAQRLLEGGLGIESSTVQVQRGATEVQVTITATGTSLFERVFTPTITTTQSRPIERLTP